MISGMARNTLKTCRVIHATGRPTRFSAAKNESGTAKIAAMIVPSQAMEIDSHIALISSGIWLASMLLNMTRNSVHMSPGASIRRDHFASIPVADHHTSATTKAVEIQRNVASGFFGSSAPSGGVGIRLTRSFESAITPASDGA